MMVAVGEMGWLDVAGRVVLGLMGLGCVVYFFKSIIRVGVLNRKFRDPMAFWVSRLVLNVFRLYIRRVPGARERGNDVLTWYWPCAFMAIITGWFLLVLLGFTMLNMAVQAEPSVMRAVIASGSALSTLGFSTPSTQAGELLAIVEGAIGLFVVVYLFTFLPGFMDVIQERGRRVAWVYDRAGEHPCGARLVLWLYRNGRGDSLDAVWEDWETFFRKFAEARSFLPILSLVRPVKADRSWVCAFGAFLDALALVRTTVARPAGTAEICLQCGVETMENIHHAMYGTPIVPQRDPALAEVKREVYDSACAALAAAGVPLVEDRERAWQDFAALRMSYEGQVAWVAEALGDPKPAWPVPGEV